jgi:hypothetical protein
VCAPIFVLFFARRIEIVFGHLFTLHLCITTVCAQKAQGQSETDVRIARVLIKSLILKFLEPFNLVTKIFKKGILSSCTGM